MNRILAICVVVIALLVAYVSRKAACDDAYITLRIARNAIEGRGFHYNVGETGVQAATSPLNLLLSFAIGKVGTMAGNSVEGSLLAAPQIVSFFALPLLALGIFVFLVRRSANPYGPTLGAVLGVLSPILLYSVGLETQLLLALIVWSLAAYDSNKLVASGLLAGFAVLARHDALILVGILSLMLYFSKQRSQALRFVGCAVLVIGPWLAYSAITFGETVPTTLASKMAQGGTAYWPGPYAAQFWKWMVSCAFGSAWLAGAVCVFAAVGVGLAIRGKNSLLLALAGYFVLHFAAYSFLNVPDYHWYFAPYYVGLCVLSGFAVGCLRNVAVAAAVGVAASIAIVWVGLQKAPRAEERFEAYRFVGRHLERNPPRTAVGMMEIGIIGFFAPSVKVFDFSGIVTPVQIPRVKQNAAIAWISEPSAADKVVTRMVGHPLEPDLDPSFERLYEKEFSTTPSNLFPNGVQVWKLK